MSVFKHLLPLLAKFRGYHVSQFGLELSVALLVKFLLLGTLWWAFYAGKQITVNDELIADKLFGGKPRAIPAQSNSTPDAY